jgi:putative glycosyltransferase (TIGR04372 family)
VGTSGFVERQLAQLRHGGWPVLFRKLQRAIQLSRHFPALVAAIPVLVAVRLIRPWLLVRWGVLPSPRIGHFAANTELYLCERDAGINVPNQRHVDIFVMEPPICNLQLAEMWKRVLHVWPVWWLFHSLNFLNGVIPGGGAHEVGDSTSDRDVNNLLDRYPTHLAFSVDEEARGEAGLRAMGIPAGTSFVCLIVRDSAYLDAHLENDWSYHDYRDSDIGNYVLAAEELANRGYFVLRMGAKVHDPIISSHPRVIDYAVNGMRSDFMDVYLGAKCEFCISTSTGFDAIPSIFRRPVVYVNALPVGYLLTFRANSLFITKHHWSLSKGRDLSLKEIFAQDVGFCLRSSSYQSNGIELKENSSQEIRDVVLEMADRIRGTWIGEENDESLQQKFSELFQVCARNPEKTPPIHGDIRIRCGATYLRSESAFLN